MKIQNLVIKAHTRWIIFNKMELQNYEIRQNRVVGFWKKIVFLQRWNEKNIPILILLIYKAFRFFLCNFEEKSETEC